MQIPLHLAAENGWMEVVKMLLKASTTTVVTIGTDGKVITDTGKHYDMSPHLELRDKEGYTPLLAALYGDYTDVANFLIQEGADVHAVDICGVGPMFYAGDAADKAFFELLISRGLDVNQSAPGGSTPLSHVAARLRKKDEATALALYLIENGASVSPKPRYNLSPLVFACESGNVDLVKELMKRMTMEEINTKSVSLGTSIYNAAFRGRAEVVKVLLDAGVDYEVMHFGETPFEAAVKEGHSDVVTVFKAFFRKGERSDGGEMDEEKEDVDVSISQSTSKSEAKSRFEELGSGSRIEELDDDEMEAESHGEALPPYSPKP
ncbi:ankyrin [Cadophora sp. DSE1049]|nr:ankyrin [Cadophora sp. DSE1049]